MDTSGSGGAGRSPTSLRRTDPRDFRRPRLRRDRAAGARVTAARSGESAARRRGHLQGRRAPAPATWRPSCRPASSSMPGVLAGPDAAETRPRRRRRAGSVKLRVTPGSAARGDRHACAATVDTPPARSPRRRSARCAHRGRTGRPRWASTGSRSDRPPCAGPARIAVTGRQTWSAYFASYSADRGVGHREVHRRERARRARRGCGRPRSCWAIWFQVFQIGEALQNLPATVWSGRAGGAGVAAEALAPPRARTRTPRRSPRGARAGRNCCALLSTNGADRAPVRCTSAPASFGGVGR